MNECEEIFKYQLKPIRYWEYLLFFGAPTILMIVCVYQLMPYLVSVGVSEYLGLQFASSLPYVTLLVASLSCYRMENRPWTWKAIKARFRLSRPRQADWMWVLSLVIFSFITYFSIRTISINLVVDRILLVPGSVPRIIDPGQNLSLDELTGGLVEGNWILFVITFIVLIFNIVGEELWWRGYLLPRQEITFGKYTWVIHGLLWTVFHVFKYWELLAIFPVSLGLSFVAQFRMNTWPGIIAHFAINSLGAAGILLLVIG